MSKTTKYRSTTAKDFFFRMRFRIGLCFCLCMSLNWAKECVRGRNTPSVMRNKFCTFIYVQVSLVDSQNFVVLRECVTNKKCKKKSSVPSSIIVFVKIFGMLCICMVKKSFAIFSFPSRENLGLLNQFNCISEKKLFVLVRKLFSH